MARSPTYEVRVKREIRDAIAIDPIASIPELVERLNKRLNHSFDPRYIKKLRDKVSRQIIVESDRMQIEDRMNITRENHRISRDALLEIIHAHAPSKDRVEAAKALVMLDLAVFKAELETGMFKKPVEEMAKAIHYEPVPDDMRMVIIAAWKRGGLLPAAVVEGMVPLAMRLPPTAPTATPAIAPATAPSAVTG
jgi:hypothetical protein